MVCEEKGAEERTLDGVIEEIQKMLISGNYRELLSI